MLSTPPATTRSASPVLMARAAVPTASSPEPQSRLIVEPAPGGQPRQEGGHPGHVAVVLARLIGAAVDHLVDRIPIHAAVAVLQDAQGMRGEVVRAHGGERPAIAADRGAGEVADEGVTHGKDPGEVRPF